MRPTLGSRQTVELRGTRRTSSLSPPAAPAGPSLRAVLESRPGGVPDCPILVQLSDTGADMRGFETQSTPRASAGAPPRLPRRSLLELPGYAIHKDASSAFQSMITIGRAPNCDIAIPAPVVSKFHGWFACVRGVWHFTDAGSTNGSAVDGVALPARRPTELKPDGLIALGGELEFRFLMPSMLVQVLQALKP